MDGLEKKLDKVVRMEKKVEKKTAVENKGF